jgi:hypothetical protein
MSKYQIQKRIEEYTDLIKKLGLLDCNMWLGNPEGFPLARELTLDELRREMDRCYINGGLISHWWGKTLSAQAGNNALAALSSSLPRGMYTIWTGVPLYPPEPGNLPGNGRPHDRMRGVRLFPKSHNYGLEQWIIGSLPEWLIEHNLPLFIWHTELDWAALRRLALKHPNLRIVIETQNQKILYRFRILFSLMRDCPNVYIETSNLVGQGYIESVVHEFGAQRLLYGSFLPVNDPFAAAGMLVDADIAESDKRLIASGNIRRLIGEVKT